MTRSADVEAALAEMRARHSPVPMFLWRSLGGWMLRGHELAVDEAALARLRALDRDHTLIWLPSHRSYLDTWALPRALDAAGFPAYYVMGGANLDFWPFGPFARRTGLIFIRRNTRDDPAYRQALRGYLEELVGAHADFGWSIEGGRTRTGKLRPPRYGVLRYVADAVRELDASRVLLVPVSIVYDRLQEVPTMAAEARGSAKAPEDMRWLIGYARRQGSAGGRVHVDFGEPVPLLERMVALEQEAGERGHVVERIAAEVCHRINEVTPVVPSAVVTLALLGAARALTLNEVIDAVTPVARYFSDRDIRPAAAADLADRELVRETLQELAEAGAATGYAGGHDVVWTIGPDQQLVAAFYRNSLAHLLVTRAIAELVSRLVGTDESDAALSRGAAEALRLRDLLKFEFFFGRKRAFLADVRREIAALATGEPSLESAVLVLRPFLEAYLVVASELAAYPPGATPDESTFLRDCLGVGRQWHLQGRIASLESVSLELFGTAVRLVRHRGLWAATPDAGARRIAFARELEATIRAA